MHTKQQKTKTKGRKRHIQVRKLVEDIEKSKKRIFRGSEISTKIRTKLNTISANFHKNKRKTAVKFRQAHTLAVFWGQSETDLHVLEQNILK